MLVLFLTLTVAALIVKVGLLEIKLGQAIDKINHCDDLLSACRFSPSENEDELRRHKEWFYLVADKIGQLHDKVNH